MDDFEKELKMDFLSEASDLLESAEIFFMELEKNPENMETLNEIFRLAHNLKGTSRAVGFGEVAELTHIAENLILRLKEGKIIVGPTVVSTLLEFSDTVNKMIASLKEDLDTHFDTKNIVEKIQNILSGNFEEKAIKQVEKEPVEEKAPEEEREVFQEESILNFKSSKPTPPSPKKPVANTENESIRVPLQKIEALNDIVGELVILQTVLGQHSSKKNLDSLASKSISQLGKLSKEIQEISLSFRMVSLKSTYQKMARIVRDTSKIMNKNINLILEGENNEIDKNVLSHLADPLVHLVRNAIDHGLEASPEDRISARKSEIGQITIRSYHEGTHLVIEVEDDGRGIDHNIIRQKAIEKGLLSPSKEISQDEIIQYIFHPGFSTKAQVTEVSGRGVGMDVVRKNIENLSGMVKVSTQIGKGSIFKISLPLTLAIIEGIVFQCAEKKFIVPLSQVDEFMAIRKSDKRYITSYGNCIQLREETIPTFDLAANLGLKKENKVQEDVQIAIILRSKDFAFAVVVDNIENQQQVVVKKIGEEITNKKGYMGTTILGDGRAAFIMDFYELYGDIVKKNQSQNFKMAS